jgi:molybdopterin converting factor small subunit
VTLTVLLFASYADALGRGEVALTVEPDATVGDVVTRLRALPGAERLPSRPLVAVNQAYASYSQRVSQGDELALIPPVSGG